jgi:hypothetical protein
LPETWKKDFTAFSITSLDLDQRDTVVRHVLSCCATDPLEVHGKTFHCIKQNIYPALVWKQCDYIANVGNQHARFGETRSHEALLV